MQRLSQQNLGVADCLSNRVVFLLPGKGQLRESCLVARRVFDVDEVLVVGNAVILWQFKQTNQGLQQRSPAKREQSQRANPTLEEHTNRDTSLSLL